MLSFIRRVLGSLNLIGIFFLLLSASTIYLDPKQGGWLSISGLFFFPLYLINLCFIPVWVLRKKWFVVFPVFAALICFPLLSRTFQINFDETEKGKYKLLTWNVKNFDVYNWSKQKETRKKMMDLILQNNPDILCLQEFYKSDYKNLDNVKYLTDTLGYPYFYFNPSLKLDRVKKGRTIHTEWGIAFFSKYPILDTGLIEFSTKSINDCAFVDLQLKEKVIRVYSTHLQSIKLGYEDYENLEEMQKNKNVSWEGLQKIFDKMSIAFKSRSSQVQQIKAHMRGCKTERILCGDFNDVPVSYSYKQLSDGMQDAFIEKGKFLGATLFGKFFLFRIDYALFSEKLKVKSYKVVKEKLSDHYPVVVEFD